MIVFLNVLCMDEEKDMFGVVVQQCRIYVKVTQKFARKYLFLLQISTIGTGFVNLILIRNFRYYSREAEGKVKGYGLQWHVYVKFWSDWFGIVE